jgi:hypothetical protein
MPAGQSRPVGAPVRRSYLDPDLRGTETILTRAAALLDFARPIAVLQIGVLQLIPMATTRFGVVGRVDGHGAVRQLAVVPVPRADEVEKRDLSVYDQLSGGQGVAR